MLWRPACPCDAACLAANGSKAHPLVQLGRWLRAAAVLLVAAVRLARDPDPGRAPVLARALLAALGIRWAVIGAPVARGALLAGNHVSWLDILLMMAMDTTSGSGSGSRPLRLVAKAEVGSWPVIGRLARACGTIFVDRSRPRSLPGTVSEVRTALLDGYPVQVFPEGTTTCGAHPAPWRPAFLQAALDAGAPVQRFTLIFSDSAAAFVADESLLTSLRRVIALRALSITVLVDEASPVAGDRRRLARRLSPRRTTVAELSAART
ncbi:MAG TPA: lysophospholipid acyltransferase family protein [Candidatus Limnocylindrales bacterium]